MSTSLRLREEVRVGLVFRRQPVRPSAVTRASGRDRAFRRSRGSWAWDLVVHRLPRRALARAAARRGPAPPGPTRASGPARHPRPAARHHDRGRRLRRGRGAGRRPPGHRREHDRAAGHREGLPQRRVLRRGLSPGTGSVGIEFVRLFQVELEHYEKIEGRSLSLEGKANRLATMVRGNLGAAMQGLVVVPLFAGLRRGHAARAGSSATTSPAAATRSTGSTPSAPARCSPGAR